MFVCLQTMCPSFQSFIISSSENGFLCLPKIHTTLSEHCVAFCCCVIDVTRILLAAWYDDFSAVIVVVLTSEFWGNVSSKLEIFITAIVSWHIKHMGLVLVGGRMNANFSVHSSLNCRFSLSTFLLAANLEHAIFMQSRHLCYSLQNVTMQTAPKMKVKVKNGNAAVCDPAVCVSLASR